MLPKLGLGARYSQSVQTRLHIDEEEHHRVARREVIWNFRVFRPLVNCNRLRHSVQQPLSNLPGFLTRVRVFRD